MLKPFAEEGLGIDHGRPPCAAMVAHGRTAGVGGVRRPRAHHALFANRPVTVLAIVRCIVSSRGLMLAIMGCMRGPA